MVRFNYVIFLYSLYHKVCCVRTKKYVFADYKYIYSLLVVKIPDIILSMDIPESKVKALVSLLEHFLE